MKTRLITSIITILNLIVLLFTFYNHQNNLILVVPTLWIIITYVLFTLDERVKPYTTFFDWVIGRFMSPTDMETYTLQSRINGIKYKYKSGPFKIRFVYKRRFTKEEIETSLTTLENELRDRAEQDAQKTNS